MAWRTPHVSAVVFLVVLSGLSCAAWIAVQASREEPLPSLVWTPHMSSEAVFALGLPIRDRIAEHWWWIEATPESRKRIREQGAWLVLAMPTPVARMAGCSGDMVVDPKAPPPRI